MLMIRLQRVGRKNDPSFRVVVGDKQNAAKSGKFLEIVGAYDARKGKPQLDAERIKYWISNGAQVSDTLHNLLVSEKVIDGKKVNVLPKKTAPKKEEPAPAEAPKAEAAPEIKPETPAEPAPEETPAESAPETPAE